MRGRKRTTVAEKLDKIPHNMEEIGLLYSLGLTDVQVALVIGVSEVTINNWKKDKEFSLVLKAAKQIPDARIESKLYESACGYKTTCKKGYLVKDGPQKSHVEIVEEEVVFQPNPTSIIFWLKNRKPDVWKDRKEEVGDTYISAIIGSFNGNGKASITESEQGRISESMGILEETLRSERSVSAN